MSKFVRKYEIALANGTSRREYAKQLGISERALKSRLERARLKGESGIEYWSFQLEKREIVKDWDDVIIVGDVQIPTVNWDFADLMFQTAKKQKITKIAIMGDFINLDTFSVYKEIIQLPSFEKELELGRWFFERINDQFDEVVFVPGNHEIRVLKALEGELGIDSFVSLLQSQKKIETSVFDRMVINNSTGSWVVAHGSNYSVNPLTVANQISQKYQSHVILHHEHHCASGVDRYGRYVLINNGGLFDYENMAYAQLRTTKSNVMSNGFTVMKDGHAHLLGPHPFTNWDLWL